jgi:2-methylcitrate dehydratase PrpD
MTLVATRTTRQKRPALTKKLARFVARLDCNDVPSRILDPLKQSIADTIGCALLGAGTGFGKLVSEFVAEWDSAGQSVVWGTDRKAAMPFAAMANSACCHAWDYDDTLLPAVLHPGSVAVPTAFAVAERNRTPTSGKALLTAIAAGYEVGNVIGTALGSKAFASGGFYNSVPTIFVAVATAAKLMRLDEEQTARALSLAASQAAGLYSATLAKRFNAPKAVLGGLFAADLARRGLEASTDSIEADYSGFLGTFSRAPDYKAIPRDLGRWRFEIYHKFYPCIRSNHPTVENVRLMLDESPGIGAERITKVVSYVDQLTIDYTTKTTSGGAAGVETVGNALISLPYCVAAMAIDGELTLKQFTPAKVRNPAIQALMKRIVLMADPAIDALPATARYRCTTKIYLDDGRVLKRTLVGPKGDPNNRLTDAEMREKFLSNAVKSLSYKQGSTLYTMLSNIDAIKDVRDVARWLSVNGGKSVKSPSHPAGLPRRRLP